MGRPRSGRTLAAAGIRGRDEAGQCRRAERDETPPSLVRLGRTERFRRTVQVTAQTLDLDAQVCSAQPVAGLAMLAQAMDRDLAEADWRRLLDALLLIAAYPAAS